MLYKVVSCPKDGFKLAVRRRPGKRKQLQPLPMERCTEVEFEDMTSGPNVPKQFVPGVKKGFLKACEKGPQTGHKVAGVQFVLQDGQHHIVDSSEYAFQLAGEGAVQDCYDYGQWHILEPVMNVEVTAPVEFQGTVLAGLSKRHAIVSNQDTHKGWFTIECEVCWNFGPKIMGKNGF